MPAPILISNQQVTAGRKEYVLPPGLAFKPTAIKARFDGGGSGSNWLSCLSFYSQNGDLMARSFPEPFTAQGEDVEVSYRPF